MMKNAPIGGNAVASGLVGQYARGEGRPQLKKAI